MWCCELFRQCLNLLLRRARLLFHHDELGFGAGRLMSGEIIGSWCYGHVGNLLDGLLAEHVQLVALRFHGRQPGVQQLMLENLRCLILKGRSYAVRE